MAEKYTSPHKGFWRWETSILAICIFGLLSLGLVLTINYVWEQHMQDFVVVDAATDLRIGLTTFHLRFEEYMHGDTSADLEETRETFTKTRKLGQSLLTGGTIKTGFSMRPLEDPALRKKAEEINVLMDKLQEAMLIRLREKQGMGSKTNNNLTYHLLFNDVIARAGDIEEVVGKDIISSMAKFKKLYRTVLIVWAGIIAGAALGFVFLTKKRRRSEEELQTSHGKYRSLVDSTEDSIYLVDEACNYLFINKNHLKRLGLADDSFAGENYDNFHTPEETEEFRKRIARVFGTGDSSQYEHQSLRDGRYFIQTFSPVRDASGDITAVTVVSKNISDRRQMENELRALSLTDELTGLYNRRGLLTLAGQQIRISNRLGKKLYLLAADVDDLKIINDTFGHQEGDSALVETARILRENFRESDIIARIGGDEFVVMPIEMSEDKSEIILSRLSQGFEKNNQKNSLRYRISISTGITWYDPEQPASIDQILATADSLMYEQKKVRKLAQGQPRSGTAPDGPP
ncbi:MAG: sensor domain-containing diguanylate cyclase [Thermodesulfovibrionales bacterium]